MIVPDPSSIHVSTEMAALLRDVDDELKDFRALGEFSAEVAEQIRMEFLPQRLSDTLNIEGVRVNPRVTRAILEGQALAESDRYGEVEILNAIAANDYVETAAKDSGRIAAHQIREIHALVAEGLVGDPGAYRTTNVEITGAAFEPPDPSEVPILLQDLCAANEAASDLHPVVRACWLHASFGAIHPFEDGNGRTGRLIQDWTLLAEGYLPVGIPASRRQEYYDALAEADGGEWMSLVAIVANSELTALERARRIAEAPAQRLQRIRSLVRASQTTAKKRDFNKYELWRRRTDAIRDEFQRWAEDLSAEADNLELRVKVWDPISFDKWQEMREFGHARGTWLFTLRLIVNRRAVYSWLFYARRHEWAYTVELEEMEPSLIGVFLTGDEEPETKFSFGQFSDPYVCLRELLHVGDDLLAYEELTGGDLADALATAGDVGVTLSDQARWIGRGTPIGDVVEHFIEQNLFKLGLVDETSLRTSTDSSTGLLPDG